MYASTLWRFSTFFPAGLSGFLKDNNPLQLHTFYQQRRHLMRIQSIPSSFQLPRVRASLQAPPDPNSDAELARQTREHREFIHEMGRAAAFVGGGTVAGACFAAILGAANHSYRPAQGLLGGIVGFMLGTLMYANNPSEYACNHFIRNPDYPGGD